MDDVFRLRDYLYETTGMYFPDSKRYFFENRFARRLQALKLDSFYAYLHFLKNHPARRSEFDRLVQEITINETSFFRNDSQFKALTDLIIPDVVSIKQKIGNRLLKIWSAGCSSGEEPYTLAISILDQIDSLLKNWQVDIIGTDINAAIIEKAKSGRYSEYTLRNVPPEIRKRYFKHEQRFITIADEVKKLVRFEISNLNDDISMVFMKKFDIIFCRNVLIYFDTQSKKRVIEHFYNNLTDHGYLFLGHSESLFGITEKFKLIHFPGGMAYKKVVG